MCFEDRELFHDPRDGPPPPKIPWSLSAQLLLESNTSSGSAELAVPDVTLLEGNARRGWQTNSTVNERRLTLRAAPWRSVQGRSILLRFQLTIGGSANRIQKETTWALAVLKAPPSLTTVNKSMFYVLYRRELECPAAIDESVIPSTLQMQQPSAPTEDVAEENNEGSEGMSPVVDAVELTADSTEAERLPRWWAHASPIAAAAAAMCQPTDATLQLAAVNIFSTVTAVHKQQLSSHSQELRDSQVARRKRRRYQDLRNTHMIHFGLDLSKPFVPHAPIAPSL